jgi:citrate synthase
MNGPDLLKSHEGPLRTRMGACFPGERTVFRGKDLHTEFKHAEWIDLYVFSITGRRFQTAQLKVLQGIWVYTSYPDPRLWNNRVAAMTGSGRGTGGQGFAAAIAVSEAAIYGRQPDISIADFLMRAARLIEAGGDLESIIRQELTKHKHLLGYGRPVATMDTDERIPVTFELMQHEGITVGTHLKLAIQIEEVLSKIAGRSLPMTYSAMVGAIKLDMGFSPFECYLYMLPSFSAGMIPCYLEALEKPEGATFIMRCDHLHYDGPMRRKWE